MSKHTPLYDEHIKVKAKIVDFSGWQMPIHYGSQIEEHHQVRQDAGVFDVSHMTVVDIKGEEAKEFLRYVLANDVARLMTPGKALYSCMLNDKGGIIDDLIVYLIHDQFYRMVVNAATREKDLSWLNEHAKSFKVSLKQRDDLVMIAVQGPNARSKTNPLLPASIQTKLTELKPFQSIIQEDSLIARTGYTGEDGYEMILPCDQGIELWDALLTHGVKPCGLGARDTLRLEAGLNLYGTDMDETTTPFESNLAWTIAFEPQDRNFIGRKSLEQQKEEGIQRKLVGLVLEEPGVLRNHQKVRLPSNKMGEITSGSFSPSLYKSIALARVPADNSQHCEVEIRGKWLKAKMVKPPFVRQGQILV